ncbi:hypothetical protein J8N05_11715 [Streptomyces sp. BH-SS-21]|uniref:Uncharacterized protein n=1 Tax=Streptomyces liliiviolaceus TaxID=2823109 RepID=A0A940XW43_9ACTN|nr:hypothetical protein [Streptomyces liliiviolaceus]MBQ0848872.1 hypothetical protein [Streptomyces liliiviolaceus]
MTEHAAPAPGPKPQDGTETAFSLTSQDVDQGGSYSPASINCPSWWTRS